MIACEVGSTWGEPDFLRFRRIVVGIDGSPNSIEALRVAVRLARRDRAQVEAVYAYQRHVSAEYGFGLSGVYASPYGVLDAAADALSLLEKAVREAFGRDNIEGLVLRPIEGGAFEVLTDLAATADLLVIGARGHSGPLALFLGSTANACVRHAKCPVLVVPARPAVASVEGQRPHDEQARFLEPDDETRASARAGARV